MKTLEIPKLPGLKVGSSKYKGKEYFYIQTYTHHYDKEKKRSIRDSQKTVGTIKDNCKYGEIVFKQEFIDLYPELNNFRVFKTEQGLEFKPIQDEEEELYLKIVKESKFKKLHGGANFAINKAMAELCVGDALKAVFNKYNRHLKIASLIHYLVLKQTPVMHYYQPFAKSHFLPWGKTLNDGQINALLKTIDHNDIMNFFVEQNRALYRKYGSDFFKGMFVALDSTSISTYSNKLSLPEYGYNKDGDKLKQVNYLMVCNQATGIPLFIKAYKGNVIDVVTVNNLLSDLKILFSKVSKNLHDDLQPELTFVTDRGYDSNENLLNLILNEHHFVMRSKMSSKWVKDIVDEAIHDLNDPNKYNLFFGQYMDTKKVVYKYDDYPILGKNRRYKAEKELYVHIYFDKKVYRDSEDVLLFNVTNACKTYKEKVSEIISKKGKLSLEEKLAINIGQQQIFIDKYCVFDGNGELKINNEKLKEVLKYKGIMVLISDNVADAEYAYFAYSQRRKVESSFQILKSTLNFNRLYVSNDQVFYGRLLCQFIATSIMTFFAYNIRKYEQSAESSQDKIKLDNYSLCRVIEELDTIMITSFKNRFYFDEISGKNISLYKALGVSSPQSLYKYEEGPIEDIEEDPYENNLNDIDMNLFDEVL